VVHVRETPGERSPHRDEATATLHVAEGTDHGEAWVDGHFEPARVEPRASVNLYAGRRTIT
jgi:hypothetical protein